ncbi:hypothetical protein [Campylobacter jejuni]|nr:hypothetical protein [Campylobacter jejuni]
MVAYVKHDSEIYRFCRIDAKLGYTINKYQVTNVMTHNDINGPLYKKLELMAISETIKDEEIVSDANEDFVEELEDNGVNYDNTIVNSKELEVDKSLKYSPVSSKVSNVKKDKQDPAPQENQSDSIIDRSVLNNFKREPTTAPLSSRFRKPESKVEIKPDPEQYTKGNRSESGSEVKPLGANNDPE